MAVLLVGARIAGMITTLPLFGGRNYPLIAKIGLVLFLTILVVPLANIETVLALDMGWKFVLLLVNEIVLGLFLGLIVALYLGFIYFAGDVIDYLIGFSMVSVLNPLDETQMPITSNLFYVYLSLVFLSLDLHHKVLLALADSFVRIEIGSFIRAAESLSYLMRIVAESLFIGFSLAAPFVITILVADIVLGLLSKAMPGMNIFILGMPFKILIGLFVLLVILPMLYEVFGDFIHAGIDLLNEYIRGIGGERFGLLRALFGISGRGGAL